MSKRNAGILCGPRRFLLLTIRIIFLTMIANSNIKGLQAQEIIFGEIGANTTLKCLSESKNLTWKYKDELISDADKRFLITATKHNNTDETNEIEKKINNVFEGSLTIDQLQISDEGLYACGRTLNETIQTFLVQPLLSPKIIRSNEEKVKQKNGHGVTLYCLIEVYPQNDSLSKQLKWLKDETFFPFLEKSTNITNISTTQLNYTLELTEVYKKENGSYSCVVFASHGKEMTRRNIALFVMDVPQVSIDYAKAVGANIIFLNWTTNDGNDPVQKYYIQYMVEGSPNLEYYKDIIGGRNTSYLLEDFLPNTTYLLRISAKNSVGVGTPHQYHLPVRTLEKDPIFIPKVETTGSTASTITIGWDPPPPELLHYIQYYELIVSEAGENPKEIEQAIYLQNSRNLPHMFDNLKTATEYEFKVRSCSDLTKICGPWSKVVNGTTMDGVASKPTELQVTCMHNNISRLHDVIVSWNSPKLPNGKVVSYVIQLNGFAMYKLNGENRNDTWFTKSRRVDEPLHKTVYDGVNPNTNYTVTVSAITRHRKVGEPAIGRCYMPMSVPETISRVKWIKVKTSDNKCVFKLFIPKISERNGPICCYRLYLVRMGNYLNELPSPDKLNISTYYEVHSPNNTLGGAYIAEMFPGDNFKSVVFLGDNKRFFENQEKTTDEIDSFCRKCLEGAPFLRKHELDVLNETKTTEINVTTLEQSDQVKLAITGNVSTIRTVSNTIRKRRNPKVIIDQNSQSVSGNDSRSEIKLANGNSKNSYNLLNAEVIQEVFDGEIDMNSNYTGFLEVIVRDKTTILTAYSSYFEVITPGTIAEQFHTVTDISEMLNIVIQVLAVLIGIVLVLLIVLCFFHHYKTKNSESGEEVISLRDSLSRALFGGRTSNHRHFIGAANGKASDVGPINKSDLYVAYKNRHKDTDYGFLREYEMLPNRFNDRTTKNSDMKENSTKNRYPDIKAYDQTRVRLSQINGIQGSDYINANFVIGYKERKKFICAQGPMESTVHDFWRMIWEQHLEIIVMLTNLEEYNKSKCAKYWPEKILDGKQFGEITVKFVSENKIGDYLVRNFDVFRRVSCNDDEEERRQITQYHYLVWKDFMAPEHPHDIIRFIRHINSVYSVQRGPILVHCSAGVGRTGTLVALDSLMQQLEEENQVSIFNTVCDLRHQRNFLVQSLKQYIFLYRALLDTAYFGNTELCAISLSTTIENLKHKAPDCKEKCKLEIEFEKVLSVTDGSNKSCNVASNEENMLKNRSEAVIPYDNNRVILTPIPVKDNSTYINASFIEGYDNSETFIITQDPMENTIGDFWRMISEQSVTTLVMISEIGDGPRKCPRYWADDEIQYEHILVKYIQSESCPYYTRREFNVTNCKIDDTIKVTQFQYNGWPTVDGKVPEVCRGIIELVDQALSHYSKEKYISCRSPLTVHCSLGTDRSSIFVGMCILVQQLRTEKSIDICSTARKIRSQRPRLLNSYAQYEFLHRAIANYADLHKLSTDVSSE